MNIMLLIQTLHEVIRSYPREDVADDGSVLHWKVRTHPNIWLDVHMLVSHKEKRIEQITISFLEGLPQMGDHLRYKDATIIIHDGAEDTKLSRYTSDDDVFLLVHRDGVKYPCDILWVENYTLNMEDVRKYTSQIFEWMELDIFDNVDDILKVETFTNNFKESIYWSNKSDE